MRMGFKKVLIRSFQGDLYALGGSGEPLNKSQVYQKL
jgi:hypothetical protein